MSGIYWGLSAMAIMNATEEMDKTKIIEYIISCQHENGGFGGNPGHDPHLLYTLSAIQILCIFDCLDKINVDVTVKCRKIWLISFSFLIFIFNS